MKEILMGIAAAAIIFLALIGIDVMPVILLVLIAGFIYFFMVAQGQLKVKNVNSSLGNRSELPFEEIGGQESAVKELKEALEFLLSPDHIVKMGIRPLKGVLLVGPPGTGKTLLARAAASYTSSVFLAASGSEFIEMYAGVGAKRIRQLFQEARKQASRLNKKSAIIFIDELEILGAKRGSHSSHMEYDQTLNQLLVEMDGIRQDEPRILLIGATNRADMLDSALMRPGRFDRQVQVGLPDRSGRKQILEIHTRNKPLDKDVDLDDIARATFGFSGAHLESLSNEAAILAMREGQSSIDQCHFAEAIDKVILGEKLDRKPNAGELERVCIHESGHAVISEYTQEGSVSSISIVPRGKALGFMRKSPQDDQYLYTAEEIERQIMIALAGAVAEEIKFDNRSTGSQNDFEQAWQQARQLVSSGLSSLGIVSTDDLPPERLYGECKAIIDRLEGQTREALLSRFETLEILADVLHEEESLDRQGFEEIIYGQGHTLVC